MKYCPAKSQKLDTSSTPSMGSQKRHGKRLPLSLDKAFEEDKAITHWRPVKTSPDNSVPDGKEICRVWKSNKLTNVRFAFPP